MPGVSQMNRIRGTRFLRRAWLHGGWLASPTMSRLPDARLFEIEAKIIERQEELDALAAENFRLQEIWKGGLDRLHLAASRGECKLTREERWGAVKATPVAREQVRPHELTRPHDEALDELIDRKWAIRAQTPEGKAALR